MIQHRRHDVLHQGRFHAETGNLPDGGNGLAHLSLADGRVQRTFYRQADGGDHRVKVLRRGAHQHGGGIARKGNGADLPEGIVNFLTGVGCQITAGCRLVITQRQPILLHHAKLAEGFIQIHQHLLRHALLKVVGGFHLAFRFLSARFGGHGVLHVLGGRNGLMGDRANAQAVALGGARRAEHGQHHRRPS